MCGPTCIFWANLTPFSPKTLELGRMQTNGSCRCITVSTLAEAEFFAAGGFSHRL
jgi:D-serine deaminase-like pyridoxal phosphate-dependent protein